MGRTTEIRSGFTGSISVQHCDDGAEVREGETICEIECMKTLWGVQAPHAGIVRHRVKLGEVVAPDVVVAIIESD